MPRLSFVKSPDVCISSSMRALMCPAEELNWSNSLGFILYAAVNK